tara:strand:- start:1074 stop:1331 length:258 start_codon:yes stop_codon:yes gene_type:complete
MKYLLDISGQKVLLSHAQLEIIAETMKGVELLTSKYLRNAPSGNNYAPAVETLMLHEWFKPSVVEDNFIDTVKLSMKLQAAADKT